MDKVFKIGAELYVLPYSTINPQPIPATITDVKNGWIYADMKGKSIYINIQTMHQIQSGFVQGKVFETLEQYSKFLEYEKAVNDLTYYFTGGRFPQNLTLEEIKSILSIIKKSEFYG